MGLKLKEFSGQLLLGGYHQCYEFIGGLLQVGTELYPAEVKIDGDFEGLTITIKSPDDSVLKVLDVKHMKTPGNMAGHTIEAAPQPVVLIRYANSSLSL